MGRSTHRPLFEFRKDLFICPTELMGYEVPHLHSWLKEKAAETTRAPSNEGAHVINLLSKSGAERQSRTDTGSPLPVFESSASRSNQCYQA